MRILLADDDPQILEYYREVLNEAGYATVTARSGQEAIRLLNNETFEVAILDWMMPEPNGLELCAAIRSSIPGKYTYTILVSGRSEIDDVLSGLRSGADDYLRKPVHPEELLLRVEVAKRILSLGARHVAVFMMAKLAESRDPDTGKHLERMRDYSWLLAKRLAPEYSEITPEFIDNIYHASPLHDIGKVGIPDSILLKPAGLTEQEFEVMKTHTTLGSQTLDAALEKYPDTSYLQQARDIALSHHENYDGSGYPNGLQGHDIPLSGRIVALADVYDALTSRRPYKRAFDHHRAKGIILERQAHFDPMVLSAFFELEEEFLAIKESMEGEFELALQPVGATQG
jgi:putative two-component system response regulator